jgi:hypothetical protein
VSAAQKYGRPEQSLSQDALSQVRQAGQALAEKGVTHSQSQANAAPAPTPAVKYSSGNQSLQRELPARSR